MIDAVIVFGLMNVLFEFVLLGMLSPRTRLRVLGNDRKKLMIHIGFLSFNLILHWGTVVGTMSAVMAFICSMITVQLAMKLFGYIVDDRHYHVGWVKYSVEELK